MTRCPIARVRPTPKASRVVAPETIANVSRETNPSRRTNDQVATSPKSHAATANPPTTKPAPHWTATSSASGWLRAAATTVTTANTNIKSAVFGKPELIVSAWSDSEQRNSISASPEVLNKSLGARSACPRAVQPQQRRALRSAAHADPVPLRMHTPKTPKKYPRTYEAIASTHFNTSVWYALPRSLTKSNTLSDVGTYANPIWVSGCH